MPETPQADRFWPGDDKIAGLESAKMHERRYKACAPRVKALPPSRATNLLNAPALEQIGERLESQVRALDLAAYQKSLRATSTESATCFCFPKL